MEEDIKIIEDLIFEMRTMGLTKETLEYAHSLENLIKSYRELEDRYLKNRQRTIKLEAKVKEKIEEYEKMKKATYTDLTHYGDLRRDTVLEVSQVLQELMEDK